MSNKLKEYAVSFETSNQITEDHWTVFRPTLKVTDDTTVGEINEWYRKQFHESVDTKMIWVAITELDSIKPTTNE